jgi:hypothetical protein
MTPKLISKSTLHYLIVNGIIENGFAPSPEQLAKSLGARKQDIIKGLYDLQEYHGVVLHPHEPKVSVIHPFSLAPTNFYVQSAKGEWWGNCAWCSLGIAALINDDVKITTTIGAHSRQIEINIIDEDIQEKDYLIHFPIPMKNAWDNVIYTCSTMLVFENENQIDEWTVKHDINKGDVQPIEKIWNFSKQWYGNHLNPEWKKWTIDEAKAMFREYDLTHSIWQLDGSGERF